MMETKETIVENQQVEAQEQQDQVIAPEQEAPMQVQQPKTYTQQEVDDIVSRRLGRRENRLRKEYEDQYGDLIRVLRNGTGKEDLGEITQQLSQFYGDRGVSAPEKSLYSDREEAILAKAEAEDIIHSGYEEVVDEVERLAKKGLDKMSSREKALFQSLSTYRQDTERQQELSRLGVSEDVYKGKAFQNFASKFAPSTPVADIYDIYSKLQPKKDIKPMGSMKNMESGDSGVKDYYTRDEALKFTQKDLDKNPALYQAIVKSMQKW